MKPTRLCGITFAAIIAATSPAFSTVSLDTGPESSTEVKILQQKELIIDDKCVIYSGDMASRVMDIYVQESDQLAHLYTIINSLVSDVPYLFSHNRIKVTGRISSCEFGIKTIGGQEVVTEELEDELRHDFETYEKMFHKID